MPFLATIYRAIFGALVTAIMCSPSVLAADIEQLLLEDMEVSATRIVNPVFDGVFNKKIYDVQITVLASDEHFAPDYEYRVYPDNGRLVAIFDPGSNIELAYFDALIDPNFRLSTETADRFRKALKAIMPDRFFESVDVKAIRKKDNQWYFLTGEFFDHYKGLVVTVDGEGAIRSVAYGLKVLPAS